MSTISREMGRIFQTALDDHGHDPGPIDGWIGDKTERAALAFMASREVPDSSVPLPTYKGAAKQLDDIDLPRIGAMIGVGEDELHAVMDVEARGDGFDSKGRVAMLFEPHIFYRELGPGLKRDRAVAEGLAYRRWGEKSYPSDSYPRFLAAYKIDPEAAMRSCSWGLGQIMGFNAQLAGYDSAFQMIEDFAEDEEYHLRSMVAFIRNAGLDDALRRHDWRAFAKGYNGASYETHGYHIKLGQSFLRWDRIPDTPFDPATEMVT